jgi:hypothetical protein
MHKRIAITALAALFVSSSMLATPALAADHPVQPHHAYQNGSHPNGNGWHNGKYYGTGNAANTTSGWHNGKYYGTGNNGNATSGWHNGKYYGNNGNNGNHYGWQNGNANGNRWHGTGNANGHRDDRKRHQQHDRDRDHDRR